MKRVIVAGILGWVVLAAWTFVVNGIFGFRQSIDMKQLAGERPIYEMLKNNVTEPGRYICNPPMTDTGFVLNEPVYSIQYAGFGHESAGQESLLHMLFALLATLLAAWMLSTSADRILRSYGRRVLFFAAIGLFLALAGEMGKYGIGGYSLSDAVILSVHAIVQWTIVGLVVAWSMKPVVRQG